MRSSQRRPGADPSLTMPDALLLGEAPPIPLGFSYVTQMPYDAVVLGSARMSQLLRLDFPELLEALLRGVPVYGWLLGLEHRQLGAEYCPALYAKCLAQERELAEWGVIFLRDRPKPPLITALQAQRLLSEGRTPPSTARITPLARDILGGSL